MSKAVQIRWDVVGSHIAVVLKALKWPATLVLLAIVFEVIDWKGVAFSDIQSDEVLAYISVLRWPLLAFFALRTLRPHLPSLIGRIREFSFANSKLKFNPQPPQAPPTTTDLTKVDEAADTAVTKASVESSHDEIAKLVNSPEATAAFEQIYRKIYGTQLAALRRLHSFTDGLQAEGFQDILQEHKTQMGEYAYQSVEAFMQFLLENTLALYNPKKQIYQLTLAGLYFLRYLDQQGILTATKAY